MIIFPQHTLKINLPRGAASKRETAHRRGGDKKRGNLLKSYNGLFDKMIERPETVAAIKEAARYKKGRKAVANILADKENKAEITCRKLERGTWNPPHHEKQRIQEGSHKKVREIVKPRFDDEQIIHHMLVKQLRPIIEPRLYHYAFGSLPGRGPHKAVRNMERWRNEYGGRRFYVLEADVKKFYDNVDTRLLKSKLRRRIRDKRYLEVMDKVIDATAPGLPKGFYTSPWLANFYMEDFDNFVVQVLKPDHYLRYMDNIFVFHRNKKELHRIRRKIAAFLWERLKLQLKDDWQVFRFEGVNRRTQKKGGRAINALGFVVHCDRVTIRKSILKRTRAKANHIHRKKRYTRHDAASMLSRMGAFKHANAYNYYLKYIKPKVSIHYCKRRLSTLARKNSEKVSDTA